MRVLKNNRKRLFKQKRPHCWLAFFAFALLEIGLTGILRAQPPADFETANQLYSQGKFSEAKQHYESLIRAGNWSANLFYNLANTEWKLGDSGAAALDYERALALDPGHPEARANLRFVRDQNGAKIEPMQWWQRVFLELSENGYTLVATIAAWLAIFSFAAIIFRQRATADTGVLWFVAILSLLACAYGAAGIFLAQKDNSAAIVVAKRADARFAPADTAQLVDSLPTASRVHLLAERGAWSYCELPDQRRAWIATDAIQPVKLHGS